MAEVRDDNKPLWYGYAGEWLDYMGFTFDIAVRVGVGRKREHAALLAEYFPDDLQRWATIRRLLGKDI